MKIKGTGGGRFPGPWLSTTTGLATEAMQSGDAVEYCFSVEFNSYGFQKVRAGSYKGILDTNKKMEYKLGMASTTAARGGQVRVNLFAPLNALWE